MSSRCVGDDRVGVLAQDLERPAASPRGSARRPVAVVARLDLIEVDGDELDRERQARHELRQQVEQRVAVLAARHRDQDAIAGREQLVALAGALHLAVQAVLEPTRRSISRAGGSTVAKRSAIDARSRGAAQDPAHCDERRPASGVSSHSQSRARVAAT